MSTSELSDLSSPLSSEDDNVINSIRGGGKIDHYIRKSSGTEPASPAKRKRAPSPPHEYVLADNPDIAVICMFRSRFSDAFSKTLQHYGPQDIERGVEGDIPGEQVERLLCALLGLVLNRKKEVERGHFQRALEEAVQTHTSQWPAVWGGKNPLHGGGNFSKMSAAARLTLLKSLALWSLSSSEAIQNMLKESYRQQRHDDDLNQPLSVQPWGRDGDKRRYWLIEGQDDTHFRLYRESNPLQKRNIWRSIAGTIDELRAVAERLGEDASQASRRLRDRITQAIPRFEASEEKRKRRDYRNARRAQFTRPELGFSLYEGRTRGKRIRYTFSDEEEGGSDAPSTRRLNRHSRQSTPAKPVGPTFTASGRQVRSRIGGTYGETMLSGQHESTEVPENNENHSVETGGEEVISRGRTRGSANRNGLTHNSQPRKHIDGYNALDEMEDESDASSSGGDWDGADDDDVDDIIVDDEDEDDADMSDEPSVANDDESPKEDFHDRPKSLVVSLRYRKNVGTLSTIFEGNSEAPKERQLAIPTSEVRANQEDGKAESSAKTLQEKISTGSVKGLSTSPTSNSSSFG